MAGKGQQRLWPPPNESPDTNDANVTNTSATADGTFRQPLPPPGIVRPRMPAVLPNLQRQALIGLRMQSVQSVQNIDARMRMLMQQQQVKVSIEDFY